MNNDVIRSGFMVTCWRKGVLCAAYDNQPYLSAGRTILTWRKKETSLFVQMYLTFYVSLKFVKFNLLKPQINDRKDGRNLFRDTVNSVSGNILQVITRTMPNSHAKFITSESSPLYPSQTQNLTPWCNTTVFKDFIKTRNTPSWISLPNSDLLSR